MKVWTKYHYALCFGGRYALFATAMILFLVAGCATANLNIMKEIPSPLPKKVEVKIEVAEGVEMPSDAMDSFNTMVTTSLFSNGFQVAKGPQAASGNPGSSASHLRGTITLYEPGSRFMRWLLPLGFGIFGGRFDSTWTVSDSKGAELAKAQIDGSVYGGTFGGAFEDVLKEAADRVADLMTGKVPKPPE